MLIAGRALRSSQGQLCVQVSACFQFFSCPGSVEPEPDGGSRVQLVAREITEWHLFTIVRIRKGKPYYDLNFFTG